MKLHTTMSERHVLWTAHLGFAALFQGVTEGPGAVGRSSRRGLALGGRCPGGARGLGSGLAGLLLRPSWLPLPSRFPSQHARDRGPLIACCYNTAGGILKASNLGSKIEEPYYCSSSTDMSGTASARAFLQSAAAESAPSAAAL